MLQSRRRVTISSHFPGKTKIQHFNLSCTIEQYINVLTPIRQHKLPSTFSIELGVVAVDRRTCLHQTMIDVISRLCSDINPITQPFEEN